MPVLLYTTEQVCVAHFFVHLFRKWHARVLEKENLDDDTRNDVEIGTSMTENPRRDHT